MAFADFQSCLKEWLALHSSQCPPLVNDITTLRNKLSYLTAEQLKKSLSASMGPSRITASICDELSEACKTLYREQKKMIMCVEKACQLRERLKQESECPVDYDVIASICNQLQQQTLLEVGVFETISNTNMHELELDIDGDKDEGSVRLEEELESIETHRNKGIFYFSGLESPLDADSIITIMACFSYPPYVRVDELQRIIEL